MPVALRVLPLLLFMLVGCGRAASSGDARASASPAAALSSGTPVPGSSGSVTSVPSKLIDRVRWIITTAGAQLQVFPTSAGRTEQASDALPRAWREIVAAAPTANAPGMYDQFRCHWEFARLVQPDKPSWNLEPWRPVVSYPAMIAASCNPGGAEG